MSDIKFKDLYERHFQLVFRAAPAATRGSESQYKDFVKKFYKGSWLADGWLEQTEEAVKAGRGGDVRNEMNTLGQRICGEWAKPNNVRTVTTDHLKEWGNKARSGNGLGSLEKRIATVEGMLPGNLIAVVTYDKLRL
ncbi:MAG: hypothetical protein KUG77_11240 [Nannocystaceae bacterium]|nr:hypothetical protein [Nannocystaceae bacterium]